MIKTVKGNLFDLLQPGDCMVHGCNAQGVMGSGIALEVKQRYPGAFRAYEYHHVTCGLLLGETVPYYNPTDKVWIVNGITQELYGRDGKRYVSYDAVSEVFRRIRKSEDKFDRLLFPLIGAGLGGGDWNVIQAIIESEFKGSNTELILVEFQK